ncbi:MAG: hypothetical protein ACRBG0_18490 [Lewinella sp.]|jgi:hypothetical protein|uniref:hypothetical protein n=1 Tax=Lewinella sp. TaxID=2004506 RepID=UPI003D6AAAEA
MKALATTITLFSLGISSLFGQFTSVNYDIEKNYFNEGQALPAEKPLVFTGEVPTGVDLIAIRILPAKNGKSPLYETTWIDFDNEKNRTYSLSANYPLRASAQYDIQFDFYTSIDQSDMQALAERVMSQTDAYLAASFKTDGNGIKATDKPDKMVTELEELIREALREYRFKSDQSAVQLSGAIEQQLASMATLATPKKEGAAEETNSTLLSAIKSAQASVRKEVEGIMNKSWSKLAFTRYVDDYPTTDKKGSFALNVGYGLVYLDDKNDNISYDNSPYAGLSFPLSNSTIAPRFLRNASVSMGVFLNNLNDDKGNEISGLLVGRPLYLGLDYKLFEFVHFNMGATFLEKTTAATATEPEFKDAYIRPFVGLSAKIDLSIGLGK